MFDILFISKRNNHGRYFRKLSDSLTLKSEVYLYGSISLKSLKYWRQANQIDIESAITNQLARDKAKFSKLLAKSLVVNSYLKLYHFIERIRLCFYLELLSHTQPKVVGLWNGNKLPNETVVIAAKALNINLLYFENGLMPDTTTADYAGVNAQNSLPRDPNFYRLLAINTTQTISEFNQRAPHKRRTLTADTALPKKYIFIPFQVPNDTQIVINSPWIKSMEQLFSVVTKAHRASKWKNVPLVFKEHPSWPQHFSHLYNRENCYFYNNTNTQELIDGADFVITINSTVGIEALLRNKRVITLGSSCYNIDELVLHANSENKLLKSFEQMQNWQPNPTVRNNFLSFLSNQYCIPKSWSDLTAINAVHIQAIEKRILQSDNFSRLINLKHG